MTISTTRLPLFLSRWIYYLSSITTIVLGMRPIIPILMIFLGQNDEPLVITLRTGLRFKVRSAMDIWVIKETCLDRDYEHYGVDLQKGWRIMDIGGGLGDFTIYAANVPESHIYAFEPFPESYQLLQENLQLNQIHNASVYAQAVGAENGHLSLVTGSGVAVRHSTSLNDGIGDMVVESITLDDALANLGEDQIDFLKMDCEGGEYDILFNASDSTLDRIQNICMEYHDNLTAHTHHELVTFLSEKGYRVKTYRNPAHTEIGFLYAQKMGKTL